MIWLGLGLGVLVGAVGWGWKGALVLGFIGWLTGVIIKSNRQAKSPPPPVARTRVAADPVGDRLARLEHAVARLEARLARLDPEGAAATAVVEPPMVMPSTPPTPEPAFEAPPRVAPQKAAPPAPPAPEKPNAIVVWLTTGNTIARVGSLILFFGLAFLLKYATDRGLVPIELRVAGVAAVGLVLLAFGWRLRSSRRGYALGLQGAGVAVLYLTTFGALRLYALLPGPAAFVLLAAIAVFSAVLAVAQDSMILAAFGAGGGFLAPILASTGGGSHVMLFGYYLLLNLGIVAIAFYKAWRPLNVMGFLFTFFIGLAWGYRSYRDEDFPTTEPFLVVFFLLYVLIAVLFARRQAPRLAHYVDGTIVFGTPLAAFGLQAALTRDMEFVLAYSSLAAAALYLSLAATLLRTRRESWSLLAQCFLALGVVFASLAIPLALDARWTSAAWALEGAAIVWIGVRQRRVLARAFGLLLQAGAGLAYVDGFAAMPAGPPLLGAAFLGAVLIAAAGLWSSRLLGRGGDAVGDVERGLAPALFAWGLAWWLFAGVHEIHVLIPGKAAIPVLVAFFAATTLALAGLGHGLSWRAAEITSWGLWPVLAVIAAGSFAGQAHPSMHGGWIAWPFALAVHWWVLRRAELEGPNRYIELSHACGVLLVACLGAWELHWLAATYTARGTAWSIASVIAVPAVLVLLASSRALDERWPIATHAIAYRIQATAFLALAMGAWAVYANLTHDGRSDPLPYLPLLNALDLAHVLAALSLAAAWLAVRRTGLALPAAFQGQGAAIVVGILAFGWINAVLLRTLHHWGDVPYRLDAMGRSVLVQASLSIFWSILALAAMVWATRRAQRLPWMLGAALMAAVVVKLFLVDLSNVGGIERIVSFIAVGVLMLVIGYFSPVPPKRAEVTA
jgi:uncharacterized membrane protein